MKIAFIGAIEFSRRTLELLIEMKQDVVGVCTLKDSNFNTDHCDLAVLCQENHIPWSYTPNINSAESIKWLADRKPDIIFCFGWSKLLGDKVLNLASLGVVGYHPAALPANRGRHPLIWALCLGLKETASTFFFMDEGADTGDILSQLKVEISDEDNATTLYEKITLHALDQIKIFVPQLESGSFPRKPQDHKQANIWRKRNKADGQIDWRMSALNIHNLVRSLAKPYPGAHFISKGKGITVWKSKVVQNYPTNIEPGKVISIINDEEPLISCGEQVIQLLETEPKHNLNIGEYL
jgi:methionyl-tRNA formyltransferase